MTKQLNINLGIIICARMTSSRFPGKSMAKLHGKPVIQWVIERAKAISPMATVVLAAPDTDESEPMLALANSLGIQNFCGSEHDVLDRVYQAARFFNFDHIMRITGDCPFIDPIICLEVLSLLMWRKLDYASNVHPTRTYPKGLDCEAFTMDCLEAAHQLGKEPEDREHVTRWMQREKAVHKGCVTQKIDVSYKNFCIDYPEDIARLEKEVTLVNLTDHMKNPNKVHMMNGTNIGPLMPIKKDRANDRAN